MTVYINAISGISPFGNLDETWKAVTNNKVCYGPLTKFPHNRYVRSKVAGEVKFNAEDYSSINMEYLTLENEIFDVEQFVFEDFYNIVEEVNVDDINVVELEEEVEIEAEEADGETSSEGDAEVPDDSEGSDESDENS